MLLALPRLYHTVIRQEETSQISNNRCSCNTILKVCKKTWKNLKIDYKTTWKPFKSHNFKNWTEYHRTKFFYPPLMSKLVHILIQKLWIPIENRKKRSSLVMSNQRFLKIVCFRFPTNVPKKNRMYSFWNKIRYRTKTFSFRSKIFWII